MNQSLVVIVLIRVYYVYNIVRVLNMYRKYEGLATKQGYWI